MKASSRPKWNCPPGVWPAVFRYAEPKNPSRNDGVRLRLVFEVATDNRLYFACCDSKLGLTPGSGLLKKLKDWLGEDAPSRMTTLTDLNSLAGTTATVQVSHCYYSDEPKHHISISRLFPRTPSFWVWPFNAPLPAR